jgi:pimeloyl-ACP methyl ester carboxylesterase
MTGDRRAGVVLIHGGLFESIGPEEFWHEPGIVRGLEAAGHVVIAPARLKAPSSWTQEVDHLYGSLPLDDRERGRRWPVVAASNGCSVALRMVWEHPDLVDRLVLCWPATAGDREVDRQQGAAGEMLCGETIRGMFDSELSEITIPVAIIPSAPPNVYHQSKTVVRLHTLIPRVQVTRGFPESPHPDFGPHLDDFVATVVGLLA